MELENILQAGALLVLQVETTTDNAGSDDSNDYDDGNIDDMVAVVMMLPMPTMNALIEIAFHKQNLLM